MNFQGVARNNNNVIIASQQISLRFSIIQGSASGNIEYTETRKATTNAQGVFSVVIGDTGATSVLGIYDNINWKLVPKFLKIEMDPAAGSNFILMGTTQLQSVAFAQYANSVAAEHIIGTIPVANGGTGATSLSALKSALGVDVLTSSPTFTGTITAPTFSSNITTGTAPFVVASTTPVTNLSIGGNAATATKLAAPKNINGVAFDGSADITITSNVDANTLTGTTLKSTVVNSNLTSVGIITTGTWSASTIAVSKGGTGLTSVGTNGQILTSTGAGTLTWTTPSSGGVPYTGANADLNLGAQNLIAGDLVANSNIRVGTATPTASAIFEMSSTTQGFLPPRMTSSQIKAINNPAPGLMVWCTDCVDLSSNGDLLDGRLAVYHTINGAGNYEGWTGINGQIIQSLIPLRIGDTYGGGILAYFLQVGDPGYDPNVQHGLIMSSSEIAFNAGTGTPWDPNQIYTSIGSNGTAIGTGMSNTTSIIAAIGNSGFYAAKEARDYNGGGYSDWFLPSLDELTAIFESHRNNTRLQSAVGWFVPVHWTSSQLNANNAFIIRYSGPSQQVSTEDWPKSTPGFPIRAIRTF